jgi:hypothetical protein
LVSAACLSAFDLSWSLRKKSYTEVSSTGKKSIQRIEVDTECWEKPYSSDTIQLVHFCTTRKHEKKSTSNVCDFKFNQVISMKIRVPTSL